MKTKTYKALVKFREASFRDDELGDKILTGAGWKTTCDTPGSFWVWKKKFDNYGEIMAPTSLALDMEDAYQCLLPENQHNR